MNLDTSGWRLEHFELRETLGTGSFGRVRLSKRKTADPPEYYAIKCMKKREIIKTKQVTHIKAEKGLQAELRHPFIVNLLAAFQDATKQVTHIKAEKGLLAELRHPF